MLNACLNDRSDSNGEDLEGYAGAGLYESITMDETQLVRVDYNDDPITCDPEFRRKVGRGEGEAAVCGGGGRAGGTAVGALFLCVWGGGRVRGVSRAHELAQPLIRAESWVNSAHVVKKFWLASS